jgi:cytochrome c oxidase assembly protein subunit 15
MLHFFSRLVVAAMLLLIFAGGLVTSTQSGLSVPDWTNPYGWFMFSFPLDKMVGGIFYEHGHRLIASTVGFLMVILAIWLWRAEPRGWVQRLGFVALAAVIAQGILGVSISHAGLAQLVFCLTLAIATVTSRGWHEGYQRMTGAARDGDRLLARLATVTAVAVYAQILLGATMRHTEAGLAIPDFPLAFGHLVPPHWNATIAIHFAHRLGAVAVTLLALATIGHVLAHHRRRPALRNPALLLLVALASQATLGAYVVWTAKQYIVNSAHVANGALVFGTALVLALRTHRLFGRQALAAGSSRVRATAVTHLGARA